jgi:predicted transcriptional regulator
MTETTQHVPFTIESKPFLDPKIFGDGNIPNEVAQLMLDPALLHRMKLELDRFIIGEDENKLLLFLIGASSYTDWNLSAIITGSSSSGKSWLKSNVLKMFNNVERYTRITSAAPDRSGKNYHKKILDLEELIGAEAAQRSLKIMISEGNLSLLTTAKDEESGKIRTEVITTVGIPTFITTTTNPEIDSELLNRVFILSINESTPQTQNILKFEAKKFQILGPKNEEQEKPNPIFNELIRQLSFIDRVYIPFTEILADSFPIPQGENSVAPRRDFVKLLYLIATVAWLHQAQRSIAAKTFQGQGDTNLKEEKIVPGEKIIIASPQDFFFVAEICKEGFLRTLFKLSEKHKMILEKFVDDKARTVADIAEATGLSESRTRQFLNSLMRKGYLSKDTSQKTHTYKLKQKADINGAKELFTISAESLSQNSLEKWLKDNNYKILFQQNSSETYISPITGETLSTPSTTKRILSQEQNKQENNAIFQTETKHISNPENAPSPQSCWLCKKFLPQDLADTTILEGRTVHLSCYLELKQRGGG